MVTLCGISHISIYTGESGARRYRGTIAKNEVTYDGTKWNEMRHESETIIEDISRVSVPQSTSFAMETEHSTIHIRFSFFFNNDSN